MIRINLLPSVKVDTKKRKIRNQIIIAAVVLVAAIAGILFWMSSISSEVKDLEVKTKKANDQLAKLKKTEAELKKYESANKKLQARIDTINNLEKSKAGPVKLLDYLSMAIPEIEIKGVYSHKVYIASLTAPSFKIKGISLNNDYLVKFLSNLRGLHPLLDKNSIKLIESQEVFMKGAKVRSFSITGKVNFAKEVEKKKAPVKLDDGEGKDEKKDGKQGGEQKDDKKTASKTRNN